MISIIFHERHILSELTKASKHLFFHFSVQNVISFCDALTIGMNPHFLKIYLLIQLKVFLFSLLFCMTFCYSIYCFKVFENEPVSFFFFLKIEKCQNIFLCCTCTEMTGCIFFHCFLIWHIFFLAKKYLAIINVIIQLMHLCCIVVHIAYALILYHCYTLIKYSLCSKTIARCHDVT